MGLCIEVPGGHLLVEGLPAELVPWLLRMAPPRGDGPGPALDAVDVCLSGDGASTITTRSRNEVLRGSDGDVLTRLLETVNEMACFVGSELAVHGALLSAGDGRGVVICGRSGAGKSTLTANLAAGGLGYVTDELVEVSDEGRVRGWRKWLALKGESRSTVPALTPEAGERQLRDDRWLVAPDRLGEPVPHWLECALLVIPRFTPGAETAMEPIPRGRALVQLIEQCFDLGDASSDVLESLADVVRGAMCIELTYGDARVAAPMLAQSLRAG